MRLADSELDRVRCGRDDGADRTLQILDAGQEAAFIEETVVNGHVKAAVGFGVEETVQAELLHSATQCVARTTRLGDAFFNRVNQSVATRQTSFEECHPRHPAVDGMPRAFGPV